MRKWTEFKEILDEEPQEEDFIVEIVKLVKQGFPEGKVYNLLKDHPNAPDGKYFHPRFVQTISRYFVN